MSDSLKDQIRLGREALRDGKKREARRIFGDLVRDHPGNAAAWWYLAALLDDPEQKVHCLQQVLRLEPEHAEARAMLARLQARVGLPTPARGTPRPVYEAHESTGGHLRMVSPADEALPSAHPDRGHGGDVSVLIAVVVIALIAIASAAALFGTGMGADLFGIQPPDAGPTLQPLQFGVPACSQTEDPGARLVFINNSPVTIEISEGPEGQERLVGSIAAGSQVEVDASPGTPVRYSAATADPAYASGGAILEVPAGSICRIPIR